MVHGIRRWSAPCRVTGTASIAGVAASWPNVSGLQSRHRTPEPTVLTPDMEARILEKTRQPPPDGSTHWSTRKRARALDLNHNHVATAWRRAGLKPHRFERYMLSDDPDFE